MRIAWQERRGVAYAVIMAASLLLIVPGLIGTPFLHDSHPVNLVWAEQFTSELAKGVLYPRWLPQAHAGLGSPTFYFYPALPYHASGLFGLIGLSTYHSLLAAFASFFALSGVGMWHWLRNRAPQPLLGALLFMVLPYHVMDFGLRGALAESLAFALLPFVATGLRRVAEGRGIGPLALAYGALIMSHLPLALLTSVFLVAPYVLWHRVHLLRFAGSLALGIGIASLYLLPALGLEPFRDSAQLYTDPKLTAENWTLWRADYNDGSKAALLILSVLLALPLAALALLQRSLLAAGGLLVVLLAIGVVPGLWSLPLLEKVQFPWRSLAIAEFVLATMLAQQRKFSLLVALMTVPALSLSIALASIIRPPTPDIAVQRSLVRFPDVLEMLPPGIAPTDRKRLLTDVPELHRDRFPPPQVPGMVVKPVLYFPRWSCGEAEPRTKLLMHSPTCDPEPVMTDWEKAGLAISLLSLLAIGSFGLAARRRAL